MKQQLPVLPLDKSIFPVSAVGVVVAVRSTKRKVRCVY